jgi:hypothetical protein
MGGYLLGSTDPRASGRAEVALGDAAEALCGNARRGTVTRRMPSARHGSRKAEIRTNALIRLVSG